MPFEKGVDTFVRMTPLPKKNDVFLPKVFLLQITCNDEIVSSTEIDVAQRVNDYQKEYILIPEDTSVVQKLEYKMSVVNPDELPEEAIE